MSKGLLAAAVYLVLVVFGSGCDGSDSQMGNQDNANLPNDASSEMSDKELAELYCSIVQKCGLTEGHPTVDANYQECQEFIVGEVLAFQGRCKSEYGTFWACWTQMPCSVLTAEQEEEELQRQWTAENCGDEQDQVTQCVNGM